MNTFAILCQRMLRSPLWLEPEHVRIVWLTLLLLKDRDGVVHVPSVASLAHAANVSVEKCQDAVDRLSGPIEGFLIKAVPEGWKILNHERHQLSQEARRGLWALQKAEQRRKVRRK